MDQGTRSGVVVADQATAGDGLVAGLSGALAHATLDRPAARNAISTAMRRRLTETLAVSARDPQVYAMMLRSAVRGVFSAGGDVRELAATLAAGHAAAAATLAEEYRLIWRIECFPKPLVGIIDGLMMGTGVGLTLFGTHRVAGPDYRFAMPETAIGLVPDVGTAHALARLPQHIGMYLALTGDAIGRADAFYLGLVTHCIDPADFAAITAGLAAADPVDPLLDALHANPGPPTLAGEKLAVIAHCFGADTVAEILARLSHENRHATDWAKATAANLVRRSPTALEVTHRLIRLAGALDLRQTLIEDYRIGCRSLAHPDFSAGVAAALVNKTAPVWSPGRLEDVTADAIDAYFAPVRDGDLELATRRQMQALRG